jgi:anti-anti-sigma regulatory factor
MTTVAEFYKIDGEHVANSLNEVRAKIGTGDGEVVLDFSAVLRIDTTALQAIEDLVAAAEEKSVRVTLRGVNVNVYKVLKLSRLTARFTFAN